MERDFIVLKGQAPHLHRLRRRAWLRGRGPRAEGGREEGDARHREEGAAGPGGASQGRSSPLGSCITYTYKLYKLFNLILVICAFICTFMYVFFVYVFDPREVRAILMECTELPPYSDAVRHVCGVPVFDAITAAWRKVFHGKHVSF